MLHYRMTHHVLSERRVKDPLRRPSSYSEHPLAIPRNGKFCGPPVCFLKNKKDGALLAVSAAAIQQRRLLAALQAENRGIKHYCRNTLHAANNAYIRKIFYSSAILR